VTCGLEIGGLKGEKKGAEKALLIREDSNEPGPLVAPDADRAVAHWPRSDEDVHNHPYETGS
jgi:hypothetical protein